MRALAAGLALALVACTRTPQAASRPAAAPRVDLTAAPTFGPLPAAKRTSSARPPAPARAAASAAAPVAPAATSAAEPRIYSITPPGVVHAGESVTWDVRTTPNVTSVRAHVSAYTFPLVQAGPGLFAVSFTVPANVPGIFHGTYSMNFQARTRDGATTERTVQVRFE